MLEPARRGAGSDSVSRTADLLLKPLQPYSSSFTLIGKGEKPEYCGKFASAVCESCLKTHYVKQKCRSKWCPKDYVDWYRGTAGHIKTVLEEVEDLGETVGLKLKRKVHLILSPDSEVVDEVVSKCSEVRAVELLRAYAVEYLQEKAKFFFGVLILHLYRPNERYYRERGEQRREEEENPENELKKWEWIRSRPNWWTYVDFSPHFHFIGFAGWLEKPKEGESFVYKLIPVYREGEKSHEIKTWDDMMRVLTYVLSHAGGVCQDHSRVHWWVRGGKWKFDLSKEEQRREFERRYVLDDAGMSKLLGINIGELKDREKKKKRKLACKKCGGALAPFEQNVKAFLKAWIAAKPDPESYIKNGRFKDLRKLVLEEDIPPQVKEHVLEALDIMEYMREKQTKILDESCPSVDPEFVVAEVSVRERERLLKRLES